MKLTGNTVLQRVPELELRLEGSDTVLVRSGERRIECGPHGLAVLAEFARPKSMSEALAALGSRVAGAEDWKALTSTIVRLFEVGVLRGETQEPPALRRRPRGYDAAPVHIAMLNDRVRTERFIAGIGEVVRPGDVVVEIGTGTGILAIAAARAGAGHVYTIEASNFGRSAEAVVAANGLEDRITVVEGWSTQIELPRRGDVLVSEMIGNDPLGEQILEVTADAVKRLLKPDARLVPSRIEVIGLPVAVPEDELAKHAFRRGTLEKWRSWYGVDFDPLATAGTGRVAFYARPQETVGWDALGEPLRLAEIDLKAVAGLEIDATVASTATAAGDLNGVLIYFETELGPGVGLSTHPARADADNHWRSPVWAYDEAQRLAIGDRFAVRYVYNGVDAPDGAWVTAPGP